MGKDTSLTLIFLKNYSGSYQETGFQSKEFIRDKESHFRIIKGPFDQNIISLNVSPNNWKQKLIYNSKEKKIHVNIVGHLNTLLSEINIPKISKDTEDLNIN